MFGKKKENQKNNSLNLNNENYQMKDSYYSNNIVVANLEYISNDEMPMVIQTNQKYIFEVINENNKIRYREIFTGFIADSEESNYFNLPYVVNITELKEQLPSVANNIHKYGLLIVLNEINTNNTKILKKINDINKLK